MVFSSYNTEKMMKIYLVQKNDWTIKQLEIEI